jgi:hypothetical protein
LNAAVNAKGVRVRPILTTLLVAALLLALVWAGQRRLIYFPDPATPPTAAGARDVELTTSDGLRLNAWLLAPTGPDRRIGVLVTPGNAGSRGGRMALGAALARHGLTVLLLDYRGYGGNPGSPTERGLARDARAALGYLTGPAGLPPGRLLYYGESLGAAVATGLAVTHPPAGLVLRSPFTELAAVGRRHYPYLPVGTLLRDRFPVAEQIRRVTAPVTVVYGTADSVVPPGQSRTVADRAGGPVRVVTVPGADHNDATLIHGEPVVAAVTDLAATLDSGG